MTLATNLKKLPAIAYLYNDLGCTGPEGPPPIIAIKRGEMGYYPVYTDKSPFDLNKELNVTYRQANAMLNGAMKGWQLVGADPDHKSNEVPKFWTVAIIDPKDDSGSPHYFNAPEQVFPAVDLLRTRGIQYEAYKLAALPKGAVVKTFAQFRVVVTGEPVPVPPPVPAGPGGRRVYAVAGGGTVSYPEGDPGPEFG